MDPPEWALLERELLHAHTAACVKFFHRYFNQASGWLETTPRFGGDDGPDDAIENVNDWPHLYALGGDDVLHQMYTKAYEGHVRQYSAAKTTDVPIARQGMYYKEFPSQFDWQHNGEGLTVFNLMPLGAPYRPPLSRAGEALCRLLHGRRSRRAQLRSQAEADQEPDERRRGPDAAQGHARWTGPAIPST